MEPRLTFPCRSSIRFEARDIQRSKGPGVPNSPCEYPSLVHLERMSILLGNSEHPTVLLCTCVHVLQETCHISTFKDNGNTKRFAAGRTIIAPEGTLVLATQPFQPPCTHHPEQRHNIHHGRQTRRRLPPARHSFELIQFDPEPNHRGRREAAAGQIRVVCGLEEKTGRCAERNNRTSRAVCP